MMPGARNAVEVCLAIQPGEKVALITDRESLPVTASLAQALGERAARFREYVLEDFVPRPLARAPARRCSSSRKWTRESSACSPWKAN